MKRCWIGAGLLLVLLATGIYSTWRMQHCQEPMIQEVLRAGELARQGDWEAAEGHAHQAQAEWDRCWGLSAALTDHEPMEQVNAMFAQLEVYATAQETVNYAVLCAQLGSELDAISDAHRVVWWNLL